MLLGTLDGQDDVGREEAEVQEEAEVEPLHRIGLQEERRVATGGSTAQPRPFIDQEQPVLDEGVGEREVDGRASSIPERFRTGARPH